MDTLIQLTMLGTGSGFSKKYYNNNALFNLNGYKLLVDCGFTAHRSLYELGMSWERDIDGILITHIHADHVGGLEEVALDGKYKFNKKIDLFIAEDLVDLLWNNCLKGGVASLEEEQIADFYNVRLISEESFEVMGIELSLVKTKHIPGKSSYSVWLENIFFSSDIVFDEQLLMQVNEKATHIYHDCLLDRTPVHTSIHELLTLPDYIQAKIWIMHYCDNLQAYLDTNPIRHLNIVEQHKTYLLSE